MVAALLFANVQLFGAKGGTKEKKGYVLKFSGFEVNSAFRNSFTVRNASIYKGSFNNVVLSPQETTIKGIITYQRGNTTFIYPYQHKVSTPKFKTPEAPRY